METNNITKRSAGIKKVWINIKHDDFRAEVQELLKPEDGKSFVVWVTDYVANSWEEKFDSLSVAIARVGSYVKCSENPNHWMPEPWVFSEKVLEIL